EVVLVHLVYFPALAVEAAAPGLARRVDEARLRDAEARFVGWRLDGFHSCFRDGAPLVALSLDAEASCSSWADRSFGTDCRPSTVASHGKTRPLDRPPVANAATDGPAFGVERLG